MNFESPYVDMPMRLTVRQNLKVFGMLYGVRRRRRPHRRAGRRIRPAPNFSTGRPASCRPGRRRASSLAKALINEPEVLLLDEPTASLDPDTADWVRGRLERYRREHRRDHAARLAQHERGRAAVRARHHDEERAASRTTTRRRALLARYGRETLEEVFLDVARGTRRARRRNERNRQRSSRSRRAASARWCCAIGICCARRGRACST